MRCSVAWETTMVQRPDVSSQKTFGSRNWEVCGIATPSSSQWTRSLETA